MIDPPKNHAPRLFRHPPRSFISLKPALPYNLVLLDPKEATAHDEQTAETGCLPADLHTRPHLIAVQKRLLALEELWVDGL